MCGPETEPRKNWVSHKQCLEAGKKKQQKTWSPPYFEDIVFSLKAYTGTKCSPVTHH